MSRYLIVDDNPAFAENVAEILNDRGHEVTLARSGEEALGLLDGGTFDALLTDMRMPFMDGAQLVHRIRRVDPELPAVVVTAFIGDEALSAARREGLLAALQKPVPVERLIGLLERARRGGLVAIVEDDLALSDNLTEALRDRGLSAVTATTVLEADAIGSARPACALVDLRLPGGPAGEALRHLAARFPGLPVFVITAFPSDVPDDVAGVFTKPFDLGALLAQVERAVEDARR